MFQNRTSGDKPKARAPYTDRYPREKVIGGLILGTAIFMAGFMAGYDYKAAPTAPATADPAPTAPAPPTPPVPATPVTATPVTATDLAPLPKLAADLAPLPKVAVAKAPDDPAPEPKVVAPPPKTTKPKGTAGADPAGKR